MQSPRHSRSRFCSLNESFFCFIPSKNQMVYLTSWSIDMSQFVTAWDRYISLINDGIYFNLYLWMTLPSVLVTSSTGHKINLCLFDRWCIHTRNTTWLRSFPNCIASQIVWYLSLSLQDSWVAMFKIKSLP